MYTHHEVSQMIESWKSEGLSAPEIIRRAARACLGWPYVFGAWGEVCTPSARGRRKRVDHPTIVTKCPVLSGKSSSCGKCPWGIGVRMYDCRGFTRWLLQQVGLDIQGGGATSQWNNNANWALKGEKKDLPPDAVACVFMKVGVKMNHTGMHLGGGEIIHCSNGVQTGSLSKRAWTHFAIPKGLYDAIPASPTSPSSPPQESSPISRPTLRKGSKGDAVKDLQSRLIALGYDLGPWGADGDFGSQTKKAVKAFQQDHGLKVDGIVGKETWKELT